MGNFFKKEPAPKKQRREQPKNDELSQVDQAKLEIRRTRTKLRKYQKQMEKEAEHLNAKIKQLIQTGKKSTSKGKSSSSQVAGNSIGKNRHTSVKFRTDAFHYWAVGI